MNLLPDTHILLWWLGAHQTLTPRALELLENRGNSVTVSVISLWEIAIKIAKRKLHADLDQIQDAIEQSEFALLPVHARHVTAYARLPRHHRDPFDRMLIAQSMSDTMKFVTHDAFLARYGNNVEIV